MVCGWVSQQSAEHAGDGEPCRTAEPIEMPLARQTAVHRPNQLTLLDGLRTGATWRIGWIVSCSYGDAAYRYCYCIAMIKSIFIYIVFL